MDYEASIRTAYANLTDTVRGRSWYRDYRATLNAAAKDASVPTFKAYGIIGVSSINTRPDVGMKWTIATMNGTVGGHLGIAVKRAAAILSSARSFNQARDIACAPDAKSGARKVRNFSCNVATGGNPCKHDVPCVTIDRWAHYVATNGERKDVPTGATYDAVASAYRTVAAELGIAPAILQAVLWVSVAEKE